MNDTLNDEIFRLHNEGLSTRAIAKQLGISQTKAWKTISTRTSSPPPHPVFPVIGHKLSTTQVTKREKDSESIEEFLERLAPVHFESHAAWSKPTQSPSNITMVIGDMHFGCEDQDVLSIFLETVSQLKPKAIVLNGDTLDLSYISRYPKDFRTVVSLETERQRFFEFLDELFSITKRFQTKIVETNANHSGNDTNGRWWRYLNDRVGELLSIPEVQEKLSYTSIFHPHVNGVPRLELVDMWEVVPDTLMVLHGDVVRKRGGFSAAALLEKWHTSLICNHTHRVGMSSRTVPAIGKRPPHTLTSYENGCACTLNPCYASAADWQHSFCIVHHDEHNFNVEQIVIRNGEACIGSLGRTLVA